MRRTQFLVVVSLAGLVLGPGCTGAEAGLAVGPVDVEEEATAFPGSNGLIAVHCIVDDEIYVMNADGSSRANLTNGEEEELAPAWSPDGTRIAFTRLEPFDSDIFAMNADGTGVVQLTDTPGRREFDPAWSPDGTRIAYWATSDSHVYYDIFVMNADGTGRTNLTKSREWADLLPAWSPDGSRIAFTIEGTEIWSVAPDGSGLTRLTGGPESASAPAWSPNGRRIVFVGTAQRRPDTFILVNLYVMRANGRGVKALTDMPNARSVGAPAWSPDGTKIVYEHFRQGSHPSLHVMNADGTGDVRLAGGAACFNPDWQPVID